MAIKINGSTIIDDSRKGINFDSVGIGTTFANAKLDVNGIVALGSSVYDANGNFGTDGQILSNVTGFGVSWKTETAGIPDKIEEGNTSAEVIDTGSDGYFKVVTEGTERFRVTGNTAIDDPIFAVNSSTTGTKLTINDDEANFFVPIVGNLTGIASTASLAENLTGSPDITVSSVDVNGTVALGSSVYDSNGTFGLDGQVLTSVTGFGVSWITNFAQTKIQAGNTSAEVIDTGSDGRFIVTTEGTERFRIDGGTPVDDVIFAVNSTSGTGTKLIINDDNANFNVPIVGNLTGTASTASFATTAITATKVSVKENDSDIGAGGTFFSLFVSGITGAGKTVSLSADAFTNLTYDRQLRTLKVDGSFFIEDTILEGAPTFIINKTTSSDIVFRTEDTKVTIGDVGAGVSCNINGDAFVGINTSVGIILTSPNGTRYRLIVANDGTLSTVTI